MEFGINNFQYMENPRISIITVVYNGERKIEDTMISVLNQTYANIEYLILDGNSSDGTVDLIKMYNKKIENREFNLSIESFHWKSEPDNGIYDAMNKAVKTSTGDWIIFMNAGDGFIDTHVIQDIFKDQPNLYKHDVIYGDDWIVLANGYRKQHIADNTLESLWKGPVFRHGAMFTKTEVQKKYPFNLDNKYRICADFDFIYHLYFLKKSFKYIQRDILYYEEEGLSSNRLKALKNIQMVVMSYKHTLIQEIRHILVILKFSFLQPIIIPLKEIRHICSEFLRQYIANEIISHVPFHNIRLFYYKYICSIKIADQASIHMRTTIVGTDIQIGINSVINRNCLLDGRSGIRIGNNVSVSPDVQLITGSHDLNSDKFKYIGKPIFVGDFAWIGSRATILQGVTIGEGAVVAVGAVVTKDVAPYTVVGGIPAKKIRNRNRNLNYSTTWKPWFC